MFGEMKHVRDNSIVYNMDNMEFMKNVPDKYYDLAVVDPPYGIGFSSKKQSTFGKGGINHEYKGWDEEIPRHEYWEQLFRTSKNQIVWGGNYFTDFLKPSRCWISWYKMQEFSTNEFELAWTSFDEPCKQFNLSRVQAYVGIKKIHVCQKPIALYDWIYTNYLPQGGKVFDSHLGSGSNRISAYKRGNIIFDSCELDEDYFNDGNARYDEFLAKYLPAELEPITKQGQIKLL